MSKYVKYTHQCDICECALFEETRKYHDSQADMPYPASPPPTGPSCKWNFDTCEDCKKELESALENLKTIMQLKRQNGEAPAEEVKMSRKEWRQAHSDEVEKERQALSAKYETPTGYDYETEESLKFRLRKAEDYIQKQLGARSKNKLGPLAMDPRKFGIGY